jgi:hypothetical protein
MKNLTTIITTLLLVFLFSGVSAQKIKVTDGTFDALKGQETINIEYTYDNMGVGKFKVEQDYIDKKVSEYNADEPGRGDTWKEAWISDRDERYHPRFEEEFNNMMMSKGVGMRVASASDYTLIVNTDFTEPGFNIGIARSNAYIDLTIKLVETGNPGNVLATMTVLKSPGRDWGGYDFDTGYRIQEAYAKGGKEVAYYLWKMYLK